jgi:hypothetical protein
MGNPYRRESMKKQEQPYDKDFTPTGLKVEGAYENDRNMANRDLFKAIIREVYEVEDVIIGHHLTYEKVDHQGQYDIQIIEEIPSADALIFDHEAAQKIWGKGFKKVLTQLALLPVPERDQRLKKLYEARKK